MKDLVKHSLLDWNLTRGKRSKMCSESSMMLCGFPDEILRNSREVAPTESSVFLTIYMPFEYPGRNAGD